MLNEFIELKQYTDEVNTFNRLKYSSLANGAAGLERAMAIISRYFIFEKNIHTCDLDTYELTKEILKAWNGYKHIELQGPFYDSNGEDVTTDFMSFYMKIENWLSTYIYNMLMDRMDANSREYKILAEESTPISLESLKKVLDSIGDTDVQCIKTIRDNYENKKKIYYGTLDSIRNKERSIESPLFNETIAGEGSENTYLAHNYEGIISSAIDQGSLQSRCVVSLGGDFADDVKIKTPNAQKTVTGGNKDFVEKMIITYFMKNDGRNEGREYEFIVMIDVLNWCKNQDYKANEKIKLMRFVGDMDTLLINTYFKFSTNTQKYCLCPAFYQKWKNRVFFEKDNKEIIKSNDGGISETDLEIYNKYKDNELMIETWAKGEPMIIYHDAGGGTLLEKVYIDKDGKKWIPPKKGKGKKA